MRKMVFSLLALMFVVNVYSLPAGYRNCFVNDFRYGIFVPEDYQAGKEYHLMIYLHGYSDTTSWHFSLYDEELQKEFPCIVLTPKCLVTYQDGWGSSWNMKESYAIKMTFMIVDSIMKEYNINPSSLHIGGTSMGAFGTFYALASRPGKFASAYAICGGGNPLTADALKGTPLWIFHGSDDKTVPVGQSRNMYNAILKAGGNLIRYTEYPGVGHNSWENAGKEVSLDRWLLSQKKLTVHKAPGAVTSAKTTLNDRNKAFIEWAAPGDRSTDDKMIWCYRIYRNDELLVTVNNDVQFFTDENVTPGSHYSYKVKAVNYYFNESASSPGMEVNIPEMSADIYGITRLKPKERN